MSLYGFVDQVADIIMSVFTQRSFRRNNYEGSDDDDDEKPLSHRRNQLKEQRSNAVCAPGEQGHGLNSNYIYPYDKNYIPDENTDPKAERYFRTSQQHRNVHWGSIEEIPEGASMPSAPGLSQYHQRRKKGRKSNYVYGAGSPSGRSPGSSRSGSPTDSAGSNDSYEGQRYPPGWYGRFSRGSRSPSPRKSRPNSAQDQYGYPRPPLHHTHIPRKGILKPPTPKDDEMLIRNLWTMFALAEQRLDYMYEFLSGAVVIGEDVLNSMLKAGELSMVEEATRHARRMSERQRQNYQAEYRPTKVPVPQKQYSATKSVPRHARSEGMSPTSSATSSPSGIRMDTLEEIGEEG